MKTFAADILVAPLEEEIIESVVPQLSTSSSAVANDELSIPKNKALCAYYDNDDDRTRNTTVVILGSNDDNKAGAKVKSKPVEINKRNLIRFLKRTLSLCNKEWKWYYTSAIEYRDEEDFDMTNFIEGKVDALIELAGAFGLNVEYFEKYVEDINVLSSSKEDTMDEAVNNKDSFDWD